MPSTITQQGAIIADDEVMMLKLFWWYNGQIAITQVAFTTGLALAPNTTYGQVGKAIVDNWLSRWNSMVANPVEFIGAKVAPALRGSLKLPGLISDSQSGGGVDDVPVMQGSCLLSNKTVTNDRSGRGRNYIPFPATTSLSANGEVGEDLFAKITELGQWYLDTLALVTASGPVDIIWGVWSVKKQIFGRTVAAIPDRRLATQRRRGALGRTNPKVVS